MKVKSRFLTIALSLALVLTTAFAGAESAFAETADNGAGDKLQISKDLKAMSATATGNTITAVDINEVDNGATPGQLYGSYNVSTPFTARIKVEKAGTVAVGIIMTEYTTISLYDESGQKIDGYNTYLEASESDAQMALFPVKKAGTYTVKLESSSYTTIARAGISSLLYPAGSSSALKNNTRYFGASPKGTYSYYKVTAPSTGYFTVEFPDSYFETPSYSVKIANYKKNNIFTSGSKYETVDRYKGYKTHIGVTKGTYYIAVKTSNPIYTIKVKFNKVTESKSGSTKGKAVTLSKGYTKRGVITAKQSAASADWYKIRITKRQKVNLKVKTYASQGGNYGSIKVTLTGGANTYGSIIRNYNYMTPEGIIAPITVGSSYLSPGTYYIKVQKFNAGNGYYQITWNK